jgi:hypothetical protein
MTAWLDGILGGIRVPEDLPGGREEPVASAADQRFEGWLVAG